MGNSQTKVQHVEIPIDQIILLEKNPRGISKEAFEKLCRDIESDPDFLTQRPPLLNKKDGKYYCYAGTQRVKACKALGKTSIPCFVEENLPEPLQDQRMLKDNLHRGVWDQDKLLDLDFEIAQLQDFGFEDVQLHVFTDDVHLQEDDFESVLPQQPQTKPGDLYLLGNHRLLCGDSTSTQDVQRLMQGEKAQLVFTDPPYNVDYCSSKGNSYDSPKYGASGGKILNDNKTQEDCILFYSAVLKNLYDHTTDNCPIYWWYALSNYPLNATAFTNTGWHISQTLIWLKETMVFALGQDYHRCYEPCMFGWKKGHKHFVARGINNLKNAFALSFEEYREAMNLWYEKRDTASGYVHPTQKPIRLAQRALKKHSLRKFIVLDLFGGSGSTLLACEQSGRVARLMELDPKYCDAIVKRYVAFCISQNTKPLVIKNGEDISTADWMN